ncbi:hypothetical protein [Actinacidiphila bryophytorum]|jgi:hypothetical protein|uniref:hypothetical protein n=1 Tax=Actinacidiphila bryophytorum TaxID=1436133 RepID=UPI002176DDA6|nr:hypothetical protein [Actinacidiphila bryophytorum]UWE07809.1 hypothetical protein NYE86_03055 [Actinacidiphila bryophytorum]
MLDEALAALAASGGAAVATAAGTDAWAGLRDSLARWFGRGSRRRETAVLERLDQTGAELAAVEPAQAESVRAAYRAIWQTRIQDLLDDLDDPLERNTAAAQLRALLDQLPAAQAPVSADHGGVAVGGNLSITARGTGSVAAAVVRDVHVGRTDAVRADEGQERPTPPDAPQG